MKLLSKNIKLEITRSNFQFETSMFQKNHVIVIVPNNPKVAYKNEIIENIFYDENITFKNNNFNKYTIEG